ncbi:MAG: aldo/keto reductase [Bernardetiaceae bacterium]|nr:aldo/keto reductase [Bernardetiaceae bacterium]
MEYRRLGKAGVQVSALSFGSWLTFGNQIEANIARDCMREAYDAGVNFFDNAEVYAQGESERVMGKILKEEGWSRDTYLVSSKVFWGGKLPNQRGLSRKHVVEACHAALKRFELEYLDFFFCHRPDRHTPIEETVWTMHNLVQQGKILYWGTSEWSAQEIQAAIGFAKANHLIPPTMEQPQYHMLHREKMEKEYDRLFEDEQIGTTIWSPLASGLLTGKYLDNPSLANSRAELADKTPGMEWLKALLVGEKAMTYQETIRKLTAIAKDLDATMAQLAIAWCLCNPNVSTAITGASKVEQVKENMKAIEVFHKLDEGIKQEIESILDNKPQVTIF